ncbi:hypothetical protein [Sediminibacterium sp.]|uniref:hypothetical protein n=1 Tax=Sediminibacterium sp. TaxID=1917865 RepID=UPI0025F42946|nr:hypothetical protein [Sediminibacterium sp.]MBT9484484.1 D-alanine--D-alanine ligase [Sediminibacterium sp.]
MWYCLKAKSFFFFNASNPTIRNGGFLMESKKEIYDLIPDKYKPVTLLFSANAKLARVKHTISNHHLQYPLIIKPDIGMQGKAVIKVNNEQELIYAIGQFTVDYIIQPFIPFPKEMGIFYVRYPNEKHGRITGIVEKEFLTVTGDGVNTIEALLKLNPRYILQLSVLVKTLGESIYEVMEKDEERILVPYGNHVRGSLFLDSTGLVNDKLEKLIDAISRSIDGFYFGRLDIRYTSFEELAEDKNWCIIELNGAGSEPTHIYDPSHSIFFAWKEIMRHWKMLYKVSVQNKRKGFFYLTYKEGMKMFKENSQYLKKLNGIYFENTDRTAEEKKLNVKPELSIVR